MAALRSVVKFLRNLEYAAFEPGVEEDRLAAQAYTVLVVSISQVEEHAAQVLVDRFGPVRLLAGAESGGELAAAEIRTVVELPSLDAAAKLVSELRGILFYTRFHIHVGEDEVGDIPQDEGVTLGAVVGSEVAAPFMPPLQGRSDGPAKTSFGILPISNWRKIYLSASAGTGK